MSTRKFLFLYLDTGAGHKSAAKVLKDGFSLKYPDVSIELANGFSGKGNLVTKTVFENGYRTACNFVPSAFSLIYEAAKYRFVMTSVSSVVKPPTAAYLEKIIKHKNITDIVSFHFALVPSAKSAVRHLGINIPISVIVTDPFTAPHVWFYEKNMHYFVYTQQVKKTAIEECGIPSQNIEIAPFLMNKKFLQTPQEGEIASLRQKYGIPTDKRIVLIAGGGEGLPGALTIVTECAIKKADYTIIVVCGRDKATKNCLQLLKVANPSLDLRIYGFINFMDELVKICNCAVIKAGPATLLEILKCQKPVIISTYIHGQEFGNVQYVVDKKMGWFIQEPKAISAKIQQLFNDKEYYEKTLDSIKSIQLDTDAEKFADQVMNYHNKALDGSK